MILLQFSLLGYFLILDKFRNQKDFKFSVNDISCQNHILKNLLFNWNNFHGKYYGYNINWYRLIKLKYCIFQYLLQYSISYLIVERIVRNNCSVQATHNKLLIAPRGDSMGGPIATPRQLSTFIISLLTFSDVNCVRK